ncbi:hypothetical protein [Mangrovibacterium diazotrophicum]|uniref:Tissue inhibitor of metalloproteinase n=1 Tax=Mangrovibacterium diazotrophicum TaxID=1261403 RepID=A0A419W5G4_9BACT|nr:hypothetical protein [Mangrovibacterium diazotrophicum]RKD90660.1 hypothetical protein BC643_1001 [Mangrovibacterium diazotrophicum]
MKKLAVILIFLGFVYSGSSCDCLHLKHFLKTLKYSEYAVIGQLVKITEVDSVPLYGKIGLKGKFRVQQVLKGEIETSEIEIIAGVGTDCREFLSSLKFNTDYVLLLNTDFVFSMCGCTYLPLKNGVVHGRIDKKKDQIMPLEQLVEKVNRKKRRSKKDRI